MTDWNRQRGFTLMELVVTVAFMGVVIVALTELFTALRQVNRTANNYTIAIQVAQRIMEKYRNTPYANITVGTTDLTASELAPYPSLLTPRTATVTVTNTAGGLKQVDVAISYKDRTGTKQVQFSSQMSDRGLNR